MNSIDMMGVYLESLLCFGTEDTGYYYIGDTSAIEDLLYLFEYDVEDLRQQAIANHQKETAPND